MRWLRFTFYRGKMLFDDTYFTIASQAEGIFRDRASKFMAFAYPLKNENEVRDFLQQLKKDHPQANHYCYAYRLTPDPGIYRVNDDREPSGSAGRPILNAILSANVTNVLVVVVRYFGGTLLGVPGLINAYRTAAAEALNLAGRKEEIITEQFRIQCAYNLLNEVFLFLRKMNAKITKQETGENSHVYFSIRKSAARDLENQFALNHLLVKSAQLEHEYEF